MKNDEKNHIKMFCIEQAVRTVDHSSEALETAKQFYDWMMEDDIVVTGSPTVPSEMTAYELACAGLPLGHASRIAKDVDA